MNEQELMKFAIERSNDPIIKNPVLRDAMNKDLGPRNMYAQGQLVSNTVDGSRPGYAGALTAKQQQKIQLESFDPKKTKEMPKVVELVYYREVEFLKS